MAIYNNEFVLKNEAYIIKNSHKRMNAFLLIFIKFVDIE